MSMPSFSRLRVQSFMLDAGRKVGRYNKHTQRAFMYFNIRIKFQDGILKFSPGLAHRAYIFITSLLPGSIGFCQTAAISLSGAVSVGSCKPPAAASRNISGRTLL